MPRYIDADALIEGMQRALRYKIAQAKCVEDAERVGIQLHERRNILFDLVTAPEVDAVPVVRCKECKHYGDDHFCCYSWCTAPDDFCSRGERREDG